MRRLFILATVALLGIMPLIGGRTPAAAQEPGSDKFEIITTDYAPWERVSRPRPVPQDPPLGGAGTTPFAQLQQYEVYFAVDWAAVPVVHDAELMVVVVQQGTFVLDVAPEGETPSGPETFLVHPSGEEVIPTMKRTGLPEPGPYYELTGDIVRDAAGVECKSMCLIRGEVEAVQVKQGDTIVAREGAICIWCLLNQNPGEENDQGLLLVTPVVPASGFDWEKFSWISAWDVAKASATTDIVRVDPNWSPSSSELPVMMGWAFNPAGAKCGGG